MPFAIKIGQNFAFNSTKGNNWNWKDAMPNYSTIHCGICYGAIWTCIWRTMKSWGKCSIWAQFWRPRIPHLGLIRLTKMNGYIFDILKLIFKLNFQLIQFGEQKKQMNINRSKGRAKKNDLKHDFGGDWPDSEFHDFPPSTNKTGALVLSLSLPFIQIHVSMIICSFFFKFVRSFPFSWWFYENQSHPLLDRIKYSIHSFICK